MKKLFVSIALVCTCATTFFAQRNMRPLTGNGISKTVVYDIKPFDMLEILWLGGNIEVEYGASKSDISIVTDENIFDLLLVKNTEGVRNPEEGGKGLLQLEIKNNYANRLWLEDNVSKIKIRTTSQARSIVYKANAEATFKNINTKILKINKDENGSIQLVGKVDMLDIDKSDNGSIHAEKLVTESVKVDMSGNGSVWVNAQYILKKSVSGNGGFTNVTDGKMVNMTPLKRVNVTLFNPDNFKKSYSVAGPNDDGSAFSYGIGLEAMGKKMERFTVGTKLYYKRKLVATLKETDDNQVIKL
jgi:Putative auto-transporter adhesin, head GIN domain